MQHLVKHKKWFVLLKLNIDKKIRSERFLREYFSKLSNNAFLLYMVIWSCVRNDKRTDYPNDFYFVKVTGAIRRSRDHEEGQLKVNACRQIDDLLLSVHMVFAQVNK